MSQAFNGKPQTAGGLALVRKYGRDHMKRIGRKGYEATVNKHFNGDFEAANHWLSRRGLYEQDKDVSYGTVFRDPGPHPAHNSHVMLQPVAMVTPNKQSIYAPSRILKPVEKDISQMTPKTILVSFAQDGVSNPQRMTAYSNGLDCWYIEVTA